MKEHLITIIIVTYNSSKTLQVAITSILQQSYSDFEIVVVDGNSSDNTVEILKKINDPRLKWVSEADEGIYDAMNKGIARALGQWIYFMGADDEFYNDEVLSSVFDKTDLSNVDFLYGNVKSPVFGGIYGGVFDYDKLLKKNISHQAIFYHQDIFERIGKYNIDYKIHADWDFNLRCYENTSVKIKYVDLIIGQFGEGGVSSNYDLLFMRSSLLPRKLKKLKTNICSLQNVGHYDEWWRFIRNARLRKLSDFIDSGYKHPVPDVILFMAENQSKVSVSLLKNGIFSKIFMFFSFLLSYHKISN